MIVNLPDGHVIAPAEQFEVEHILNSVSAIPVAESQQEIPKSDVHDIVLAQRAQVFLALDVKPLDFVEEVAFQQRGDIGLHRVGAGGPSAFAILQESLVHQRVANRGN